MRQIRYTPTRLEIPKIKPKVSWSLYRLITTDFFALVPCLVSNIGFPQNFPYSSVFRSSYAIRFTSTKTCLYWVVFKVVFIGAGVLETRGLRCIETSKKTTKLVPGSIPVESLKALENEDINIVLHLLSRIYEIGCMLEDMLKSIFITSRKTKGATDCKNFRTFSFMSQTLKLLPRILVHRIEKKAFLSNNKEQFVSMSDRKTRNAISSLRFFFCWEKMREN